MAKISAVPPGQRAQVAIAATVIGVVVVSALYWAQVVFIPLALAVFLAFLLNPLVRVLQRRRLGRVPSVLVVVLLAALLLVGLGSLVTWQVTDLVSKLPDYSTNIQGKVHSLRNLSSGSERLEKLFDEVAAAWTSKSPVKEDALNTPPAAPAVPAAPPAVVMQTGEPPVAWTAAGLPWPGATGRRRPGPGAGVGCVHAAQTRGPAQSLPATGVPGANVGHDQGCGRRRQANQPLPAHAIGHQRQLRVGAHPRAFPDRRPSCVVVGLSGGRPALRPLPRRLDNVARAAHTEPGQFPRLGATDPGCLVLIVVLELVDSNIMEPWLFSHSLGVSEVALLVAAAFWAFLWGPVGLVLSGPLTVCLVVLGKYIPQLEFLDVILGDEPALDADVTYYQRLLARDQDEATQLVLTQAKTLPPEQVYDGLLVPAFNYVKQRPRAGRLDGSRRAVRLAGDAGDRGRPGRASDGRGCEGERRRKTGSRPRRLAKSESWDVRATMRRTRLALEMLRQLLDPARWEMEILSMDMLSAELVARAGDKEPAVVCIGALPPGGLAHTRYLCKRLRARLPAARIVVGRWGLKGDVEQNQEQLLEAGADQVETALLETRTHLTNLVAGA